VCFCFVFCGCIERPFRYLFYGYVNSFLSSFWTINFVWKEFSDLMKAPGTFQEKSFFKFYNKSRWVNLEITWFSDFIATDGEFHLTRFLITSPLGRPRSRVFNAIPPSGLSTENYQKYLKEILLFLFPTLRILTMLIIKKANEKTESSIIVKAS
jgi:hypothetical protein